VDEAEEDGAAEGMAHEERSVEERALRRELSKLRESRK
jgi:hypothetical protein